MWSGTIWPTAAATNNLLDPPKPGLATSKHTGLRCYNTSLLVLTALYSGVDGQVTISNYDLDAALAHTL